MPLQHSSRSLVLALYTASGFTALVYQMLWTRYLKLVFGSTSLAVTTIVASFMAGLALGSYYFGKRVDAHPRPLWLYGVVELGVGFYAALFPLLYALLESMYLSLTPLGESAFLIRNLIRFTVSFGFLLLPTFLMGGTFPIICRFYVRKEGESGIWVGRLYGLNTLGAVVGVICGGLFFPLWFGIRDSLLIMALLNILIGFFAVSLSRRIEPAEQPAGKLGQRPKVDLPRSFWVLALALFASGAAALSYEILWVRILGIVLGSSVYAFTLILAIYLAGLALGSGLYTVLFGKRKVSVFLFALIELSIGFFAILTFPLLDELPYWIARYVAPLNFSFLATHLAYAGFVFCLILMATLLMGATIPCAIHILSEDAAHIGEKTGVLYSLNTVGSILGAFLAGFFLIPHLGIIQSFTLTVMINMGVGLFVMLSTTSTLRQRLACVSCTAGFSIFIALSPSIDQRILTRGSFLYAHRYTNRLYNRELYHAMVDRDKLLYYRDGTSSSVAVFEHSQDRFLTVNAKIDASNSWADMSTQTLLGYIPLLLHGNAREVLIVGLGSGVTLSSVLDFPVEEVVQVEIESAVIEAATYFEPENRGALRDPKTRIAIEDGRNYLLSHRRQFDVIISEPSNPWMAGVANLFSREQFRAMKERLAPGGLACQWLQLYFIHPEDVRMVIRTFYSVFPESQIFQTSSGDLLLIGFEGEPSLNPAHIQSVFAQRPEMSERLQAIRIRDPLVLFEWSYRMDGESIARYVGTDGRIHDDDRPYLELSAPRSLHESYRSGILKELAAYASPSLVERHFPDHRALASHYLRTAQLCWLWEDTVRGNTYFRKALETNPEDPEIQLQLSRTDFDEKRVYAAIRRAEALWQNYPKSWQIASHLAEFYLSQRLLDKAEPLLQMLAAGTQQASLWARLRLAEQEHRPEKKVDWLEQAYAIDPKHLDTLVALAEFYRQQDPSREISYLQETLASHPDHHLTYVRLGELALEKYELAGAKDFLLKGLAIHPADPQAHALLAKTYLALDQLDLAYTEYLKSLSLQ